MDISWTLEVAKVWINAYDFVAHTVALAYPREGYPVLMFLDASDKNWGNRRGHL